MENYYNTLGINSSATPEEIRRAYRILARRYHPDVNPGKASEEKFKTIAKAYEILSDAEKRRNHDLELETSERNHINRKIRSYAQTQRRRPSATDRFYQAQAQKANQAKAPESSSTSNLGFEDIFSKVKGAAKQMFDGVRKGAKLGASASKLSIIEVSVDIRDALLGIRKTVELEEPEGRRKVSISIPPGVRSGSVLRLAPKNESKEELVIIVRVAEHPFIHILAKGVVVEIPISISEAMYGASIPLPTFEDTVIVKVPAGTQSGHELRLKGKGARLRDGGRSDLFYRFLIKVPEANEDPTSKNCADYLNKETKDLRRDLPKVLPG